MKKIISHTFFFMLIVIPFVLFSQSMSIGRKFNVGDVKADVLKDNSILVTSEDKELKRRVILIAKEKDTLLNVSFTGKICEEIPHRSISKKGEYLQLIVFTYKKNECVMNSCLYWNYFNYSDIE